MSRSTTPTREQSPNALEPPGTPGVLHTSGSTVRVQRRTPMPSTPGGHRRIASIPRTPGSSLPPCSSSPACFTSITVHTAKCSECDQRNLETMLRCPGCTFQVCKPCRDKREAADRSLAHGNTMTPRAATPGTGGNVVRRKPVSAVKSVEKKDEGKETRQEETESVGKEKVILNGKVEVKGLKGTKRMAKPAPKPKVKAIPKARATTPSYESSDDEFAPDPASPTASKRRRTGLASRTDGSSDVPSSFLKATDRRGFKVPLKAFSQMTTDELLAHHGVNTSQSPYKAHLLSRHEPVVSDPVIKIPEVVKRRFKPRPTAEEIQQNIQVKVREKMGLGKSTGDRSSNE
ncbi:uncharacterized protein M421DRAFT_94312 [Didymella exigua CBS 183.55]|uniref:Uncharacterized protein n=1 Tax=Didymella exigua CBS 183.55 TaxID=1150837 RepID=A0A6A5RK46_9PLEO|nr:uncharacterized protein M421DRAFT_94312 [Didymella exigua CBS 183.55]KAF1925927.1 hypothetical protein M421DRAFT_94312 [Didymella exigua CBS 183.55]